MHLPVPGTQLATDQKCLLLGMGRFSCSRSSELRTKVPLRACAGSAASDLRLPLLDEDYLILSTIHSAKGRRRRLIPSEKSAGNADDIEEERQLLYVAMTPELFHN
jgi:hypothetical protein